LIQHKQTERHGIFFVPGEEDEFLAELVYARHDDRMVIEHTEVSEELRGQNVGYQLVQAAVEFARSNHLQVVPVCQFAHAIIQKKPEFQDIVAKD
jgi:uncharacterized protein